MPQSLDFAGLGEAIGNATAVVRNNAASADLGVAVPTRPGWTMRDLVVDLGWDYLASTAALRGDTSPTKQAVLTEASAAPDLLQWLDDAMVDLLNALAAAAEDRQAWFHTGEAPADRQRAARRLCHAGTLHAVDAMAARLGRTPTADEVWFSSELARDGIEWMLEQQSVSTQLRATGSDWTVAARAEDQPDGTIVGSARALYLALAGRGKDVQVTGDGALLDALRVSG